MPQLTSTTPRSSDKVIWYFILCWFIFNALQAFTLELHADEAYYWLYARNLDWGYFDHPPMVAVFIRIGYSIFQNEFGTRLLTVITNSASIYLLWSIVKQYGVTAKWFMLLVPGIFIFHIYGVYNHARFAAVLFYYPVLLLLQKVS